LPTAGNDMLMVSQGDEPVAQASSGRPAAATTRAWFAGEPPAGAERVVAVVRLLLCWIALGAIYLDPTNPRRYASLVYVMLFCYAVFSLAVALLVRYGVSRSRLAVLTIHAVDVTAATMLTLFSEGPASPFYVLFGFTLLATGFRWGMRETLATGFVSAVLFGLEALILDDPTVLFGIGATNSELNRLIIRCGYLVLLAVMVGYIAEQEKTARREAAATASAVERGRVARELHDGIVQSTIALKMQVELLRRRTSDPDTVAVLHDAEALLMNEISNLRMMMFEISPVDPATRNLSELIADTVDRFDRLEGISARFVSRVTDAQAPAHVCREVGRILQEALVNVRKHAGARNVLVSLSANGAEWMLVVDDDGRGFDFEGRQTHADLDHERRGPRVVKERIRLLGGSLVVDSKPGFGARLEMTVPRRW
jgi:signal transduction histidine kinase